MKIKLFFACLITAVFAPSDAFAETGDDNPTGVSGSFNGEITTGGMYDGYTGNAKRVVDDIVVPGSVGVYPLKWTRYFNSHLTYADNLIGGAWRFSYLDYKHSSSRAPCTPDGRRITDSYGVEEYRESPYPYTTETLHMSDGGTVVSTKYAYPAGIFYPQQVIDPYGQITTLTWVLVGSVRKLDQITEPGGRYLKLTYDATNSYITKVEAFDGIAGHPAMQSVTYTWTTQTLSLQNGGGHPNSYKVLTRADYSDGTAATYTYTEGNYPVPCSRTNDYFYTPMLATADDPHFAGPMKQIAYIYATSGNKTRISSENHLVNGAASEAVSTLTGVPNSGSTQAVTETRGDGQQRTFNYYKVPGGGSCAGVEPPEPQPTDGKLYAYTDFQGHTSTLDYDTDGFITKVTDANNNATTYTRSSQSYAILRITHPDGTYIDQTYTDEANPYYLASRTDENLHRTDYTRDSNNRITRRDYPADGNTIREYETFTYNSFGQTLTHRMRTGAYEHFSYDSRGLLLAKTNPTWNSDWASSLASDPKTTFIYYTSTDYAGVWTDRVKTQTDPRGLITQFDYDRTLDANGENSGFSTGQTPVGGRGLVTRVTYVSDSSNYQSFGFDKYANKLWEENEMPVRERVSYTYDDYRRVLTIKNPLNKIVTNTYTPTNGTNTSPYVHTTGSVYTTTTPTGIVTKNIYDPNFRKTSTTQAFGTSLAATTNLIYDTDSVRGYTWIGQLVAMTDPKGNRTAYTYDTRNRKITEIDALNQTTQWFYDAASNVSSIQRKDGTTELKTYDQMNRVLTDTVPQTNTINITTTFNYYPGNVQYGGLMKQVIDADNHITTFTTYDPSGLKTVVTYPNNDTHVFGYDNDKNVVTRQTANTTIQNFTYDSRNRKTTMYWTNPNNVSNFTAEWSSFGYDAASRLTSAQNGSGGIVGQGTIYSTITRQYDAASRLILDRQNLNVTLGNKDVQYSYDDDGKDMRLYLTSASYDYTFSYDAMGRFEKILPTGGAVTFQYKYDAASNETERDNIANSINQIYTRDALNRMSKRDVKLNTTVLSSETYGFDPMSRITSTLREDSKTDTFTYYLDGELWSATYGNPSPTRNVTYNIDQMGNRTSVVDTGVTTAYTQASGGLNQYSQVGANTLTNGNEHEMALYQNITYGYVNDERLASVNGNGHNYSLLYDALGRCISRTDGSTTYYIYDGEKPIVEYSQTGAVVAKNLYGKGIDEILMRTDPAVNNGQPFYYQDDHEGSVTHLTNSAGTVIENYRYDVFGAPTINGGTLTASAFGNRFMFTGREYTSTFGIYEYRARAYHPGLGRFTGEDPKGFEAGDYNLFRYVTNDPLDKADPTGLDPVSIGDVLDRASIAAARQCLRISETNSDHKGLGWERAKTVGVGYTKSPHVRTSKEATVGEGTQFKGPQKIQPPDRPDYPAGRTGSYVHNHTNDVLQSDGTLSSPGDKRNLGDVTGKPFYTIARDTKTKAEIIERYRPSDANKEEARIKEGGTSERLTGKGWQPIAKGANPSQTGPTGHGTGNEVGQAAASGEPGGAATKIVTHSVGGDTGTDSGNFSQLPPHIP